MGKLIFLDCNQNSKVTNGKVYIKDAASVYCEDKAVVTSVEKIVITTLSAPKDRKVVAVLDLIKEIEHRYPQYEVCSIGEKDLILEWENITKWEFVRVVAVCFISFFGTAFTIMAFHNDIGIVDVFDEIYRMTGGDRAFGLGMIELSYCIGLFLGITIFFNHIGKKKRGTDPTPIMVAMNNYEKDVNETIIEHAKKGK